MKKTIRLGTRGSPLALIQAEEVRRCLFEAHPHLAAEADIDIIPIRTSGDWRPEHKDRRFIEIGGNKGLFTKEIEEALIGDYIDMAVHSLKDLDSVLPEGLEIGATLARNDARDAFIGRVAHTLAELPSGAVVGTSSLRRQAQILAQRPDLRVVPLRGNVETRLKKLQDGMADATLLAVAGLSRLGFETRISSIFSVSAMLPAAAQGILGVEIRAQDQDMRELLVSIDNGATHTCAVAERAVMRAINGTCITPAGAYATLTTDGHLAMEAMVARADGTSLMRLAATGSSADAEAIGEMLGRKLRERSPADLFAA